MLVLSHVRLTRFGCFADVALDLSPLSVLVGPNDSGKSTFLKGIMASVPVKLEAGLLPNNSAGWKLARQTIQIGDERLHWKGGQYTELPSGLLREQLPAKSPWNVEHPAGQQAASFGEVNGLYASFYRLLGAISRFQIYRFQPAALRAPSPPASGEDIPHLADNGAGLPTLLSVLALTKKP